MEAVDMTNAILKTRAATFPIIHEYSINNLLYIEVRGTGFFVREDGHFLTCLHVMTDTYPTSVFYSIGNLKSTSGDRYIIREIKSNVETDTFLGKIDAGRVPFINLEPFVTMGMPVAVNGYGNPGSVKMRNNKPYLDNIDHNTVMGHVYKKIKINYSAEKFDAFLLTTSCVGGHSGSPCTDINGGVIGVAQGNLKANSETKYTIIISSDFIAKTLKISL